MAQAFITTYTNTFRWKVQETVPLCSPDQDEIDCVLDKSVLMTIEDNVNEEDTENFAKVVNTVKQMQLQRMNTTYRNDYCKDLEQVQAEPSVEKESFENQLLESCKLLYNRKDKKVLKPLKSSRKINGYIRPQRLFTPLTTYQKDIGQVGYDVLLKGI